MMSVACVGLGDVGGAATHAGPGGLVGLALVGRFREIVLTHSSGGSLALIEPVCAALAFIAMAPALGMNRTDLPLIFRILRAPFLWGVWLVRAGVGLWRGRPQPFDEEAEPPSPAIGYAEIPGEIDASQYDPARFETRLEQIPIEGAPLPPRDSLMVDAPYSPIERPRRDIPRSPRADAAAGGRRRRAAADSVARAHPVRPPGRRLRIEPILGRLRAAPAPTTALPERGRAHGPAAGRCRSEPVVETCADRGRGRRESLHARRCCCGRASRRCRGGGRASRSCRASRRPPRASAPPRPASASSISATASTSCRRSTCCRCRRGSSTETKIDEGALEQNARLLETVLEDFGVKGQIVKVRPGPGRDALRARARARHQGEPRHRPRRRHRPLDERGLGARRHRAGPQRDRHRAAQRAARDGVPARAAVDAALRGQPPRPAAGAGQGHRRRSGDRRSRAHAASADRRHHRLGQVGGGQHHDPVAALPAAAGSAAASS